MAVCDWLVGELVRYLLLHLFSLLAVLLRGAAWMHMCLFASFSPYIYLCGFCCHTSLTNSEALHSLPTLHQMKL